MMMRFGILLATVWTLAGMTACDKNSTPINEADAPREAARSHIANAIQDEDAKRAGEITVAAGDGATSVGVVAGEAPLAEQGAMRAMTIEGIALQVPAEWRDKPAAELTAMRAADFLIPPGEGETRGVEIVVFYFGPGQGGSADANIQRWIGQVEREPGASAPTSQSMAVNGLMITTVLVEGTLKPSMMGPAPTEAQPGSALHGAVIEGGAKGALFIKTTGPAAAVKANLPALKAMLESARREKI